MWCVFGQKRRKVVISEDAQRAEDQGTKGRGGVRFLGTGAANPSAHQLGGLVERSKLTQWSLVLSHGRNRFLCF